MSNIKEFLKGEKEEYRKWIDAKPGYIWIHGHNKVHQTSCIYARKMGTKGARKQPRERIWGATKEDLLDWLRKHGRKVTSECKLCTERPRNVPDPPIDEPAASNGGSTMKELLDHFRQVILYGPPGTGKTREAKRLALAILSGKELVESITTAEIDERLKRFRKDKRFELIVFHPAYEYEQFVGGIEPTVSDGVLAFQVKAGIFLQLCRRAEQCSKESQDRPVVLVIDEINRGNLPKLLGELVYALEYRDQTVTLPFVYEGREDLVVPGNVYILATMNSSDRSIGHIDVAIRRRFALCHVAPDSRVIRKVWREAKDDGYGEQLVRLMEQLNAMLSTGNDANAGAELGIGHSYFIPAPGASGEAARQQVQMKWEYQVQPLLREYAQLLNLGAESLGKWFCPLAEVL